MQLITLISQSRVVSIILFWLNKIYASKLKAENVVKDDKNPVVRIIFKFSFKLDCWEYWKITPIKNEPITFIIKIERGIPNTFKFVRNLLTKCLEIAPNELPKMIEKYINI